MKNNINNDDDDDENGDVKEKINKAIHVDLLIIMQFFVFNGLFGGGGLFYGHVKMIYL